MSEELEVFCTNCKNTDKEEHMWCAYKEEYDPTCCGICGWCSLCESKHKEISLVPPGDWLRDPMQGGASRWRS